MLKALMKIITVEHCKKSKCEPYFHNSWAKATLQTLKGRTSESSAMIEYVVDEANFPCIISSDHSSTVNKVPRVAIWIIDSDGGWFELLWSSIKIIKFVIHQIENPKQTIEIMKVPSRPLRRLLKRPNKEVNWFTNQITLHDTQL